MDVALVHMSPEPPYRVLGVWLAPHVAAYLHTTAGAAARSAGEAVVSEQGSDVSWEDWCMHLDQVTPTSAMWAAIPRLPTEEGRHVLARVVATEALLLRAAAL